MARRRGALTARDKVDERGDQGFVADAGGRLAEEAEGQVVAGERERDGCRERLGVTRGDHLRGHPVGQTLRTDADAARDQEVAKTFERWSETVALSCHGLQSGCNRRRFSRRRWNASASATR
jgi:hypothetical protein